MEKKLMGDLPKISAYTSIGSCLTLSILYVSSLYIWRADKLRDHPSTVKKRFCSVAIVMFMSPFFVYGFSSNEFLEKITLLEAIGIRKDGLIPAIFIPTFLTGLFYMGPLSLQVTNGAWKIYFDIHYWKESFMDLLWLRNHIVAPLSEEFTFRSCMMPLILQTFEPLRAVFITPLFFGVAHFHHIRERLKIGMDIKMILIISGFQFTYTTLFGFYSAYLFVRTNHFISPFLAHAFCNFMGFPHIDELNQYSGLTKIMFISLFIFGFIGFVMLLPILTNPIWYENNLYEIR